MSDIKAAITAVGGFVPETKLTNKDLEKLIDTTDEWITSRTGIKERRIERREGAGASDIAVPAVLQLCEKRGISPEEIDLLICATVTADYIFPSAANIITDKINVFRMINKGFLECTGKRKTLTLFFLINFNNCPPDVAI